MKRVIPIAATVCVAVSACILIAAPTKSPSTAASPPRASPFVRVDLAKAILDAKAKVVPIQDNEASINGDYIKRVELGRDTAIITYFNRTKVAFSPRYNFRVYDAYGIELGDFSDIWAFQRIQPEEVHKEDHRYFPVRMDQALRFTGVPLPADWAVPAFLVIEGDGV